MIRGQSGRNFVIATTHYAGALNHVLEGVWFRSPRCIFGYWRGHNGRICVFGGAYGLIYAPRLYSYMAGYRRTPVLGFRTCRDLHWEFLRLWAGFELPSSCRTLPCYAAHLNRNILDFMRCCGLKSTSGHRISTTFNGQNHFKQIAGSEVLDEFYNSYLRK
jgi:hypothetical protein